ncbi:MAG: molybdopterin-binding protein [Nitrospira sp.]|nr:molybdopterin-binding protein [bacterium]MBL7049831.1 molybdopterin-binding protein [Nitrospira sp.]
MCDTEERESKSTVSEIINVEDAVGMVLSHDITEIRPGEFKGRAFKKGHIVREEDIPHLQRLGKEHLYILKVGEDEMHENDAADALAKALIGEGVKMAGEPNEGKINIIAERDGLLSIDKQALLELNMLGEVMCATIHNNTIVIKDRVVAGTRAIPLVVKKSIVNDAVKAAATAPDGVLRVKEMRKPNAGIVITGSEVFYGRIKDAFKPVITKKIKAMQGTIAGVEFAPDNAEEIEKKIKSLIQKGADLIVTTGGMSVDPDDVTRFAIRNLGVSELHYGSPVLPGSMFLVAYAGAVPILGIPACGMYADITVFDLILPRILTGEHIGRKEIAELGHGGLCLKCETCRYPVCPFGK